MAQIKPPPIEVTEQDASKALKALKAAVRGSRTAAASDAMNVISAYIGQRERAARAHAKQRQAASRQSRKDSDA